VNVIGLGLVVGLALALAVWALRGLYRVEEGQLAVLTRFGAVVMEPGTHQAATFGPGLHYRWPWLHVHKVAVKEQIIDLTGREGGLQAMAADGTVLRIDCILRFTPVKEDLHHYLFDLEEPQEHIKGLFVCLLRNEIANVRDLKAETAATATDAANGNQGPLAREHVDGSSYALIRSDRRPLSHRIEAFCSQIGKRYGVRFDAVDITDILPPDELRDALNAVMHARADVNVAYARAQAECQRRELAAVRGVEIASARARAVEEEIDVLASHLTELERNGTLERYVDRRRQEVLSQSRALFVRSE
jgi:regulator of protease activity HflC (stomatin/prohibitin superfamily)